MRNSPLNGSNEPPNKVRGIEITVPELSRFWAVSARQIRDWISEGMPIWKSGGKGVAHILDSAEASDWLYERIRGTLHRGRPKQQLEENDPRHKLHLLKLEQEEIKLAEARGDLIPISKLTPFVEDIYAELKRGLLEISTEIRDEVPGSARVASLVDAKIRARLNGFAKGMQNVPNEAREMEVKG